MSRRAMGIWSLTFAVIAAVSATLLVIGRQVSLRGPADGTLGGAWLAAWLLLAAGPTAVWLGWRAVAGAGVRVSAIAGLVVGALASVPLAYAGGGLLFYLLLTFLFRNGPQAR